MGIIDNIFEINDIVCLTETKTIYHDNVQFPGFEHFSMPVKKEEHKFGGIHGISLYVRNGILDKIDMHNEDTLSDSILWAKLTVNTLQFYLGVTYLPHENSVFNNNDIYENIMLDIATLKSKYDIPFVLIGDFNARTGLMSDFVSIAPALIDECGLESDVDVEGVFKKYNIPIERFNEDLTVNKNGKKLIELCEITDLKIINGRIGNDQGKGKFTCYTGMGRSTIDYCLISPDLIKHIANFEINDFERALSDSHCGMNVGIYISPDKALSTAKQKEPSFKNSNVISFSLKWDAEKQEMYKANFDLPKINELIDTIDNLDTQTASEGDVESISLEFKNLFIDSARLTGLRKETRFINSKRNKNTKISKPWFDTECYKARKSYLKFKSRSKYLENIDTREIVKEKFCDYKRLIKKKKHDFNLSFHQTLRNNVKSHPREFWKMIKGKQMSNTKIDINVFKEHFESLNDMQNVPEQGSFGDIDVTSINHEDPINEFINEPFTEAEVKRQILLTKNNKAAGFDRLINEYFQNCPDIVIKLATKLFNLVLNTGIVPKDWCLGMIQPIFKNKGDNQNPDNYRGITLLNSIGKLFTSCINTRLTCFVESAGLIDENQAGFRQGYCTMDHIFVLNSLIELYLHKQKRIYACFVDYRKAFDLVDRSSLWQKLNLNKINGKILNVIRSIYDNAKSCIKSSTMISDFFPCKVGVRQGDNLSPLLFSLYLSDFQQFLSKKFNGVSLLPQDIIQGNIDEELNTLLKLYVLLYADDTVILAETEGELQNALIALEDYCALWKLEVNIDKTKIIIFSRGKVKKYRKFTFAHLEVEVVTDYVYLGVQMHYNNSLNKAIEKQITLARKAMFSMLSKVNKLNLPIDIQFQLFDKLVISVLLYGCEIWGYQNLDKIELFHRTFLKQVLKISKFSSKAMVHGETGRHDIKTLIYGRLLNFWNRLQLGDNNK